MKPPYSIPMEIIWHGAKSLAYRLGAECFGSTKRPSIECLNEQKCLHLCKDLRKINASKHTGFAQNHISKVPSFVSPPNCLQSADMKYIILFLNIRNWEIKRRFRSIDTVARCQTKIIGACMYHWTSCTRTKLCMDWNFIHIMPCYSQ